MIIEVIKNINATNNPAFIEIVPFVRGRLHFRGCSLSFSISIISFIIYNEEDTKQNEIKAKNELYIDVKSYIFNENTNGAITKRFFNQLFILIRFNHLFIVKRSLCISTYGYF